MIKALPLKLIRFAHFEATKFSIQRRKIRAMYIHFVLSHSSSSPLHENGHFFLKKKNRPLLNW